jgi:hemerythrin
MQPFVWSEEISVGVPAMDAQHRELIDLLNVFAKHTNPGVAFDTVMRMFNYAAVHFHAEEALLEQAGYPEIETQRHEHQMFLSKTTEFSAKNLSDPDVYVRMATYLTSWLLHHIMEEDMKYKPFIRNKGV